jgi:hypothetical protein
VRDLWAQHVFIVALGVVPLLKKGGSSSTGYGMGHILTCTAKPGGSGMDPLEGCGAVNACVCGGWGGRGEGGGVKNEVKGKGGGGGHNHAMRTFIEQPAYSHLSKACSAPACQAVGAFFGIRC